MVRCSRDDQAQSGSFGQPKNSKASLALLDEFDWGDDHDFPLTRRVRTKEEIDLPEFGVTIPKGAEGVVQDNYLQALEKEDDRRVHVSFDCDGSHVVLAHPAVLALI